MTHDDETLYWLCVIIVSLLGILCMYKILQILGII